MIDFNSLQPKDYSYGLVIVPKVVIMCYGNGINQTDIGY
jgi:hypothetical protein